MREIKIKIQMRNDGLSLDEEGLYIIIIRMKKKIGI